MTINSIIFAAIAGVLTFIFADGLSGLLITNVLLGLIAGKLLD
ncbi:hypothetical protein ACFFF5_07495 [Lederbergia wuyishanensis]|uniref:Uncharacterized protein n=1 Tax=Lederbergia wuyishanensis TaxID=1347903 RepID=A0ABU0D285_9BACI|nr:hypothetical protein [Lederbergia wuyishanensis]MDQ0342504.1 hypothetical protein [Lederbergia wuyishanensis]